MIWSFVFSTRLRFSERLMYPCLQVSASISPLGLSVYIAVESDHFLIHHLDRDSKSLLTALMIKVVVTTIADISAKMIKPLMLSQVGFTK